jgi:hypothetical protein
MVGPDALPAEDALGEIPDDERVGFLKSCVIRHRIKTGGADPQFGCYEPKLTSISLVADNAGFGMVSHHEADDVTPVVSEERGVCLDGHPLGNRGDTGSNDPTALLILHDAEPAGTRGIQVGMMAQGRYPDAVVLRCLEDAGPGLCNDGNAVDGKTNLFHALSPKNCAQRCPSYFNFAASR